MKIAVIATLVVSASAFSVPKVAFTQVRTAVAVGMESVRSRRCARGVCVGRVRLATGHAKARASNVTTRFLARWIFPVKRIP